MIGINLYNTYILLFFIKHKFKVFKNYNLFFYKMTEEEKIDYLDVDDLINYYGLFSATNNIH